MERGASAPRSAILHIPGDKEKQVTKTEVKNLAADDLRALLSEYFENITADHTAKDLKKIVDDNWEFLDAELNPQTEEEVDEELAKPNPRTDLYSGRLRGPRETVDAD